MLPIVAIVGRPNVGKSTLFNALTRSRAAIVADVPGVTRDRQYGYSRVGAVPCVLIDTGGLIEHPTGLDAQMRVQTEKAVAEADSPDPGRRCARRADGAGPVHCARTAPHRQTGVLALNKAEGLESDLVAADFHTLGLGDADGDRRQPRPGLPRADR